MATYAGIAATSEAIAGLLREVALLEPRPPQSTFTVTTARDLRQIDEARSVVSLYLYKVTLNPSRRNNGGRIGADGTWQRPALPLDLHYLLTAWSPSAAAQQSLLGWCAQTLHDNAVLPAGLLNRHAPQPDVFRPEETIELIWESVSQQDLADIWEVLQVRLQPSAAYVARVVEIDSARSAEEHEPVRVRTVIA
jgi:hypothetical protein